MGIKVNGVELNISHTTTISKTVCCMGNNQSRSS